MILKGFLLMEKTDTIHKVPPTGVPVHNKDWGGEENRADRC